jgi:hypothetical protein
MAYEYRVDIESLEKLSEKQQNYLKQQILELSTIFNKVSVRFWDCTGDCTECWNCRRDTEDNVSRVKCDSVPDCVCDGNC